MLCLSQQQQHEIPQAFKLFCLPRGFTRELSGEKCVLLLGPFPQQVWTIQYGNWLWEDCVL